MAGPHAAFADRKTNSKFAPEGADIWLDGGHNPGAGLMIARHMADLEERDSRPLILICGMLNTKDPLGYFNHFTSLARKVITVPIISSDAGISAGELAGIVRQTGLEAQESGSLKGGSRFSPKLCGMSHTYRRFALSDWGCIGTKRHAT